jgi:hypothetical protein
MVQGRSDVAYAPAEPPGPSGEAQRAGALGLHKGIGDKASGGCSRWPRELRLRSTLGQLVMGRCHATNLCDYCARLAAVENTELLALDAMNGIAPQVWMVLGTGTDELDPKRFYSARKHLMKAIRRAFPERSIEWAALVEFTTGYSEWAAGRRFPHWNVLLKGLDADDLAQLRAIVARVWCGRPEFRAVPEAQHVGLVGEAGGLMKYLALHFQKESQAPPKGWRGHRFLKSRGYLWLDTPAARGEARQALRLRRELWKAQRSGLIGEAALEAAHLALYEANELAWELVRVQAVPVEFDADGMPAAWSEVVG